MASYTVHTSKHQTLAASTVDTVTVDGGVTVTVHNRGAADIFWTVGLGATAAAAPTVSGDDTFICLAGASKSIQAPGSGDVTTVKLISSSTPAYSVEVI